MFPLRGSGILPGCERRAELPDPEPLNQIHCSKGHHHGASILCHLSPIPGVCTHPGPEDCIEFLFRTRLPPMVLGSG